MDNENINFNEQYRIRLASPELPMRKHEIVKLIIVCEIMRRTKGSKAYQLIYTEKPMGPGKICDVYHKNKLNGDLYCYEIQSRVSKKWLEETMRFYDSKGINWQLIDLKKLSNDINKLSEEIKELVLV